MYSINLRIIELYGNLMELCQKSDAFFFVDQMVDGVLYRIFTYRLASYSEWLHADALECRGHTFAINDDGSLIGLASLPFEKFFNFLENPMTFVDQLNLNQVNGIYEKMDGSLITTVRHKNDVILKSKQSFFSTQATEALNLLNKDSFSSLLAFVDTMTVSQRTVIMEYTGASNRIVLGYDRDHLTILGVRDNRTMTYMSHDELMAQKGIADFLVKDFRQDHSHRIREFIDEIPHIQDEIEGYVLDLGGQRVKIKTTKYLAKHKAKDSVNAPRRLFEAVVHESSDDLRSMFYGDEQAINLINEMEIKVAAIYNHTVKTVEAFYNANKLMERKDYAILGQKELDKGHFPLAMNLYIGRNNDYKEWMIKHWKELGIKDEEIENEE